MHRFTVSAQGAALRQNRSVTHSWENYFRSKTCISYSATEGTKVMALFLNSNSKSQFQKEELFVTK